MEKEKWKEAVDEMKKDPIAFMEITNCLATDLTLEHPEICYRDAMVIVKNTINRAHVGNYIRKEMEYFVRTGKFREVE